MEFKWPSGGSGSGDVVGPGSATDNAVARFDGTSGKLLQNSSVTLSDAGVMAGATIDGDDNTVQDLPLTAIKTVLGDAAEVLRRDSSGVVVSGPMTVDDNGNTNGIKTVDVRNDDDLSGTTAWMLRMENRNDTAASHPHVEFRRARASNADLQNGDTIGGIDFHPRHNGTNLSTAKFNILYTGDGTTRKADAVLYTSNDAAPAERVRVAADGAVTVTGAATNFAINSAGRVTMGPTAGGVTHLINGDLSYSDTTFNILADTSDGSDTKRIQLSSGGSVGSTRGSYITMYGNEYGSSLGGRILFSAGDSADAAATAVAVQFDASATTGAASSTILQAAGRGSWVVGPTAGLGTGAAAYHNTHGSLVLRNTSSSLNGHISAFDTAFLTANTYQDGGGTSKALQTVTGYTRLLTARATASGTNVFTFQANYQDAQTADSALVTTNTLTIGTVTAAGAWSNISGGSWGTISDIRLKKHIQDLDSGLSKLMALRPVVYQWRDDNAHAARPTVHFIADEVQQVEPSWVAVGGTEVISEQGEERSIEDVKSVQFSASFNAYLVKAIQELKAENDALKARIEALENLN